MPRQMQLDIPPPFFVARVFWGEGVESPTFVDSVGWAILDGSFNGPLITDLPSNPLGIAGMPDGSSGTRGPEIALGQFNPSDSSLTVYWTQTSEGWQLESSTSPASGSWTEVPTNKITIDGTNGMAGLNTDESTLFLRPHQTRR